MLKTWAISTSTLLCAFGSSVLADDRDQDGIDDALEQQLLDQFAPVINADQVCASSWVSGVPVPVDPSWFLRNGKVVLNGSSVLAVSPTLADFIANICTRADAPSTNIAFLHPNNLWGFSTFGGDSTSWAQAAQTGAGVFGRVWRPWGSYPNLYSVQYFLLLSANQPTVMCAGFHDGDWLCFDYCVDTGWPGSGPFIRTAVLHNHGKQILLTRESIEFENGHPVVYLEPGVNEPWPNRSTASGYASWPDTNGFAKNWLWNEGFGAVNEENVTSRHGGSGCRYRTNQSRSIRNVGEIGKPVSDDPESQAVLLFSGKWGFEAGGCWLDAFFDSDNPTGPAFNGKIWNREFTFYGGNGYSSSTASPLSRGEDPIRPNLDRTMRFQDEPYGGCEAEDPGYLYSHCFHYFLPIAYVWKSYPGTEPWWGGDGRQFNPYRSIPKAVDGVASHGVLRIGAGTYSGAITISKPMVIETYNGPATIGQ